MKVLIVTQYYPPEKPGIASTIAHGLFGKGHDVRVLTGYPNYPEGKVFPGYKQRWRSREHHDGVEVMRVPLWTDHSSNAVRRILNYLSFAFSSATARYFARDVDVIYIYATQMTPALGPWLWRKFRGAPYVLHVQDLWPDSILEASMVSNSRAGKVIRALLEPWLRNVYKHASAVIGIAPTMVRTLIDRGCPENSTALIFNWSNDDALVKTTTKQPEKTEILFAGNIGDMQDLETVVRAARLVEDLPISFNVVGDGVSRQKVMALASDLGCTNILFPGSVESAEMPAIYAAADFSLVTLRDLEFFRGTIPSKFQGSIAHGVPIISTVPGDLRDIVEEHEVGITASSEDAESLAQAIREAHNMNTDDYKALQKRTREVYIDHFSRRAGIDAVETVLVQAASHSKEQEK